MKNGNLITLQATELDAVAGGAASVTSSLNNAADLLNGLGLTTLGKGLSNTLTAAGTAFPLLATPISIPAIVTGLGL